MSNFKKILTAIIAVVMIIGMLPISTFAEIHSETHSFTIPTAQAGGSEKPLITIGTISDSHVDYTLQDNQPYVRHTFIKAMDVLKAEGIDVLLVGGDMVSGNEAGTGDRYWEKSTYDRVVAEYKKYASAASTTGKTLWALGNHDYEVGMHNNSATSGGAYSSYYGFVQTMIETNGQPNSVYTYADDGRTTAIRQRDWVGAHYNINGFDFVIINSDSQSYSAGTLNWLDKTLSGIGANKTVFVLGHYPLQDNRGVTNPTSYGISGSAQEAFKAVMNKYDNAIYLYGHNHGAAGGLNPWIATDVFERITHYDANGAVVNSRMAAPTSFITAFMGSAGFYTNSLGAADPEIVQAMTITVYSNRIEFKMINCGVKNGGFQKPFVWTVYRNPLNSAASDPGNIEELYTLDGTITTAPGWTKGNFALYYMDMQDGVLKNDWKQAGSYIHLPNGGHEYGTFDKRQDSSIRVFPQDGISAVIQFTAPQNGIYKYEALVASHAKTAGGSNKQVVFSVMKNGVIYEITQPNNKDDYNDVLSGTIELEKGDTLLFVADNYVRLYYKDQNNNLLLKAPDDRGPGDKGWIAGYYSDLSVALLSGAPSIEEAVTYKFDGTGLDFTEGGYSIKANDHFSIAAINYSSKKLLDLQYGKTDVYDGEVGAALHKGASGNVTIAYRRDKDDVFMYGPYGSGNTDKNIAAAIAFTAPAEGTYNLTALLQHDWDYNSSTGRNFAMIYEILDKNLNVIFSGNTANLYTGGNVTDTLSRAGGSVYLKKGETAYLAFRAAPEATDVKGDAMAMKVLSLSATRIFSECTHSWNSEDTCTICGEVCTHSYSKGYCSVCGKACSHSWEDSVCSICNMTCTHSWKNGACTVCKLSCTHNYGNDNVCDTCGYKKPVVTTTPGATTKPGTTTKPEDSTPDSTPGDTTAPDVTPGDTTVPDTTDPDNGNTTKPGDTTVPDATKPNDDGKGGNDDGDNHAVVWIIVIAAVVIVAGITTVVLIKKKKA